MDDNNDWAKALQDHPIFELKGSQTSPELSLTTIRLPENVTGFFAPSERRQTMVMKGANIIVAVGTEIRMASLSDLKMSPSANQSYKTLQTPNIQFEICQIALNPNGKLLALSGKSKLAVVVLPHQGYNRMTSEYIDCKAVEIGSYYHATRTAAPIVKIDWHPWGDAGSTLLVMTMDGKLREYDISTDTEEPQQVLSFVPEKKSKTFHSQQNSETEVASFTIGKGGADWGPLTVYAVMKSGDVYSICPYMPQNAVVPSIYILALETFVEGKVRKYKSQQASPPKPSFQSTMFDYQEKYIAALQKQLPPEAHSDTSNSFLIHPPMTVRTLPLRQGPYLLQPSPRTLEGSEIGDATDIVYLALGTSDEDEETGDNQNLGALLVAYQDGKVDLFLDTEKTEATWSSKHTFSNLPTLVVYESIDLGLLSMIKQVESGRSSGSVSQTTSGNGNYPVFLQDPLYNERVYVYHAFGTHGLDVAPVSQHLYSALHENEQVEANLEVLLQKPTTTEVWPILSTFSAEQKRTNPVTAVVIPNDVYLTYSMFVLTSAMRPTSVPLNLRSPSSLPTKPGLPDHEEKGAWLTPLDGPPSYMSILAAQTYRPPSININRSNLPKLSPPDSQDLMLTPDNMRLLGKFVTHLNSKIQGIYLAYHSAFSRVTMQKSELVRQSEKCKEIGTILGNLKSELRVDRVSIVQNEQKALLARLDGLLQELMRKASPNLNDYETKWFEELNRMKTIVLGRGKYDDEALVNRTNMLKNEYDRILPSFIQSEEIETPKVGQKLSSVETLGLSQAFHYGERSNIDRTKISDIEKEVMKLAQLLAVSLGHPPAYS